MKTRDTRGHLGESHRPSREDSQTEEHALCESIYTAFQSRHNPQCTPKRSASRDENRPLYTAFTAAALTIAEAWKQRKRPLTDEWINTMRSRYTMEYYSALKRNAALTHATTWKDLEDIMLVK